MRRLLVPVLFALAFAAVPASADPLIQTCGADDFTVARVEAAGFEVAHVCTSEDPRDIFQIDCDKCPPLPPTSTDR